MATNNNFQTTATSSLENEELNEDYIDELQGYTDEELAYLRFIKNKTKAKKKWDR